MSEVEDTSTGPNGVDNIVEAPLIAIVGLGKYSIRQSLEIIV